MTKVLKKAKKRSTPKTGAQRGRPADPNKRDKRYQLKHHPEELELWRIAAATTGRKLGDWIATALNGEAKTAHHVPVLKRGGK